LAQRKFGLAAVTADAPAPGSGSRIYSIGGGGIDFQGLVTVEVFDLQANDWAPVAPMPTARLGLGAAVTSGRIHAIGGRDTAGYENVTTHEIYEPATNTWSTAAPMPTARQYLGVVTAPDGLVYAIGGHGATDLATVEVYDPVADAWTTRAPMPTARGGLAAVAGPDGLIYAIAGLSVSAIYATVETYDPATDTWNTGSPLPAAAVGPAVAVGPNGLIYVIGGTDAYMKAVPNVYSYNPTTPAAGWSPRAKLLTARYLPAAATGPDGLVYVMGGADFEPESGVVTVHDSVEAYTYAENDGTSIDGIDVADLLKELVGKTVGGAIRGAGGGIIVGGHYIPIPPRSPVWSKVLGASREYLDGGIDSSQLAQMVEKLQPRPGRATRQPNLGKRPGGKQR
jgi:N-acetylneuraminic acid mutarotase